MITCPFCQRRLGTIKNHFPSCRDMICPDGVDKVSFGYERLYGISRSDIEEMYLIGRKGLREIERETGIPYRVLRHLASSYGIRRDVVDSIRIQNEKNKSLFLAKYGVENPFQIPDVKEKIVKTKDHKECYEAIKRANRKKYGVENPFQIPAFIESNKSNEAAREKRRQTCVSLGIWTSESEKTEFERYFCEVRIFTRRNRKSLFKVWDGRCFYTGERLITNEEFGKNNPGISLARNSMRPTIDHKVSIIRGFRDKTQASVIGGVENLCICSQRVNSQKNYRTIIEFLKEEAQNA